MALGTRPTEVTHADILKRLEAGDARIDELEVRIDAGASSFIALGA